MAGERVLVPYVDYLPDDHAEALASFPSTEKPCAACPYTEGTEAYATPITRRLAIECAEARSAFWCHLTVVGEFPTHLCGGWRASIVLAPPKPGG